MTNRFSWATVIALVLCAAGGLAVGWFVAPAEAAETDDPAADDHADHGVELSPATLANLGVTVGPIEPRAYVRTMPITATVALPPSAERAVSAPLGGRVLAVAARLGDRAAPGAPLVTLLREPLPRPSLTLTANVLRPGQEDVHEAVVEVRRHAGELEIARAELARVEGFTAAVGDQELPVVPRQRAIDLGYAVTRAEAALERATHELVKHGLSEEQVDAVVAGGPLPALDAAAWRRALARNGLWPAAAEALHGALPEEIAALPWAVATVGELAAMGLADDALVELVADPAVARRFLDVGVLLQRGHTIEEVRRLHALGALEPVVAVAAPEATTADGGWDVRAVHVQPGDAVTAGAPLVGLEDPTRVLLRAEGVGGEVAALLGALESGATLTARPVVAGAGPELTDLRVAYLTSAPDGHGSLAVVEAPNTLVVEGPRRTWGLRRGQRYRLEVPRETFEQVYVLSPDAVASVGADEVVYLRDGDSFRPVPVAVAHRDERAVIVPARGAVELFPGDEIALSGAFELGLALQAGDGATDVGHGHSH